MIEPREPGKIRLRRSYADISISILEEHGRVIMDMNFFEGRTIGIREEGQRTKSADVTDTWFLVMTPEETRSVAALLREDDNSLELKAAKVTKIQLPIPMHEDELEKPDLTILQVNYPPPAPRRRKQLEGHQCNLVMEETEVGLLVALLREAANVQTFSLTGLQEVSDA
jgi:hypothetical protein